VRLLKKTCARRSHTHDFRGVRGIQLNSHARLAKRMVVYTYTIPITIAQH